MTNALSADTRLDQLGALPAGDLIRFARAINAIDSKVNDAGAVALLIKAKELRVPTLGALQKMSYINGKVYMEAELMHACARERLGDERLRLEFPHSKPDKVTGRISTDGGETWNEVTWTYADAQQAGLAGKDNWKRYPERMLRARVKSWLIRDFVPESALGMYTPDEAADVTAIPHREISSAEAITERLGAEAPADDPPFLGAFVDWRAALEQADSRDALHECLTQIAADDRLSDEDRRSLKTVATDKARKEGWSR